MSEYQYVYFQAVDRALDDSQLEFMRRQSTRAQVSRREFTNEYHFGDFHGDSAEMLRRGFDVHLHYANFGTRRLMFRLPRQPEMLPACQADYGMDWIADAQGPAGILVIDPESDAGTYTDAYFNFQDLTAELAGLREMLIAGDFRPLYIAWLACCHDDDLEPPVPASLSELPSALVEFARFYELGSDLLAAATERSPALSDQDARNAETTLQSWVCEQSEADLRDLVIDLLSDPTPATRTELLAFIREESDLPAWPAAEPLRHMSELLAAADLIRDHRVDAENRECALARQARLKSIAADPEQVVANVKQLVKQRSTSSYQQAAQELCDLREALGGTTGTQNAQKVARQLVRSHPTLNRLKAALRQQGLLPER
jgi:hypothetical protein